ncbi:helix-turn-helix domain-containing protein [Streptomyces sp. NPDC056337]|uniref:helix-turn-helix domain-containing protein n=1 Tax=Streptomyces sp. NPDC056337 TaxID=3345787 RepID=UPI0035E20EC0
MTSHQQHPGEQGPAEDPARPGEDLAALLDRLLAEAPGKTQKDLATEAGISYPTLNAWINRTRGTSRIDPDRLRDLVAAFRKWGVAVTPREMFAAAGRPVPGRTDVQREERLLRLYRQLPEDKQRDALKYVDALFRVSHVSAQ